MWATSESTDTVRIAPPLLSLPGPASRAVVVNVVGMLAVTRDGVEEEEDDDGSLTGRSPASPPGGKRVPDGQEFNPAGAYGSKSGSSRQCGGVTGR